MGDYFERIIDLEVSSEDAGALGADVVEWMVSRRWLLRETSRDAMYSLHAEEGYAPGPEWARIAADWGDDWLPGPVAVITGRHAHYPGQGAIEPASAVCPHCGAATVIIDYPNRWEADPEAWQPFSTAIDAWEKTGAATAGCASCGTPSPITDWRWADDFALGALAFDFWGWPPLSEGFRAELAAYLGHRTVHHSGKF